ncbi:MAG: DUF2334 domain-containing protein [Saprospiraceae bacterium]|nr:DUF2334 domain-containing protein [Saprospiraceae bacterium]
MRLRGRGQDHPHYFDWIKKRAAEGFEFWNHGYCHCKPIVDGEETREFRGTEYTFQLEQLTRTQQLAQDKLGLTLRTFGAPYNATDDRTALALATIPELKVWLYKETTKPTAKFILERNKKVNIEYPVHVPNFQKFKAAYQELTEKSLLTIQGHPRSWVEDKERFEDFQQIIRFLKSENAQFVTPFDYYLAQTKN